ncbi:unnamed protein product [Calicophoron daubneyi]|uniref:Oxidation resistance protein 1 n=1 Tax=Calicophoron daubneyi TaxID=300641 RepID=A0AAV2T294_CALDB
MSAVVDIPQEGICTYEVKSGDSLAGIAARFGYITPTQLARINHLSLVGCGLPPVFPGQKLKVPTASNDFTAALKSRRAPGSALRVQPSSSAEVRPVSRSSFTDDITVESQFYAIGTDAGQLEEDNEEQFVKIQAQRVLPSGDFVNGVLLITPASLCFDAAATAIAQKNAYLATHSRNGASGSSDNVSSGRPVNHSDDDDHESSFSSQLELPKELLDLGVCVPLESLGSMSTASSLSSPVYHSFVNLNVSPPSSSTSSSLINTKARSLSGPVSPTKHFDPFSEPIEVAREAEDFCLADTYPEPKSKNVRGKTPRGSGCRPKMTRSVSVSHPISWSATKKLTKKKKRLNSDTAQPERTAESDGYLYLRLTEREQNEAVPNQFVFRIATDKVARVFAFLLRAGVSQTGPKIEPVARRKTSRKQRSAVESREVRRSLIEEALESMEKSSPLPTLYDGTSNIMNEDMLKDLSANFPTYWTGSDLRLIYKTEQDGYSLATLYRKSHDVLGAVVLLIRDSLGKCFGAFLSERMRCSQHFYGTGECYIFHWNPEFKEYHWTRKNYYFMRGSLNSFQIGGQSGRNAIWFDGSLKYGRSEATDTFDNPVLSTNISDAELALLLPKDHPNLADMATVHSHQKSEPTRLPVRPAGRMSIDPAALSMGMNSVPFVIDTLEVWELIT